MLISCRADKIGFELQKRVLRVHRQMPFFVKTEKRENHKHSICLVFRLQAGLEEFVGKQ